MLAIHGLVRGVLAKIALQSCSRVARMAGLEQVNRKLLLPQLVRLKVLTFAKWSPQSRPTDCRRQCQLWSKQIDELADS